MSKTLNLCDHLLLEANRFQALGVDHQALRIFGRLAKLRDLPKPASEEVQFHLAELQMKKGEYAQARRHLAAALAYNGHNAEYHYLMACAHDFDPNGKQSAAYSHYRICTQLDKNEARYHCDAGIFAAERGYEEVGLAWLRSAAELAPHDVEIIGEVVACLQGKGHYAEARKIALAALFRNCKDSRFQQLWRELRFQELHHRQQKAEQRREVRFAEAQDRVFLPFLKLTIETPTGRKLIRKDSPGALPPPRLGQRSKRSGKMHA